MEFLDDVIDIERDEYRTGNALEELKVPEQAYQAYKAVLEPFFTKLVPYLEDAFESYLKALYMKLKEPSLEEKRLPDNHTTSIMVLRLAADRLEALPARKNRQPIMSEEALMSLQLDDGPLTTNVEDMLYEAKRHKSPAGQSSATMKNEVTDLEQSEDEIQDVEKKDIKVDEKTLIRRIKRDLDSLTSTSRSRVLTEALTCPICMKQYSEESNSLGNPHLTGEMWSMKCGHVICYDCLYQWHTRQKVKLNPKNQKKKPDVTCPICNQKHYWSECHQIYISATD